MEVPEISIPPEQVFELFGFPVTSTFLLTLVVAFLIFLVFSVVLKKPRLIPKKIQNFLEYLLEGLFNYINSITGDERKTIEIFPLTVTLFIFILCSNLLELLPGVSVFHFLRSPSSDLNFTLGLAIPSMVLVHLLATKKKELLPILKNTLILKIPFFYSLVSLRVLAKLPKLFLYQSGFLAIFLLAKCF